MSPQIRKPPIDAADSEPAEQTPLEPPRFTIRSMLLAVALLGAVLATAQAYGGHATVLLVILALAVVAHVAGNAIGTQLRDRSARSQPGAGARSRQLRKADFAPKTSLAQRESLGRPLLIATLLGALAGGMAGTIVFTRLELEKATWQDTLLGAVAFAMLGGMGTFVAAGFAQVMIRAWRQAEGRRKKERTKD